MTSRAMTRMMISSGAPMLNGIWVKDLAGVTAG
jgi:hypothetical protein